MFTTKKKRPDIQKKQLVFIAEKKISSEHNVPFLRADHLPEVFLDSVIAMIISTKETNTFAIVKNVIGSTQKFALYEKLKKPKI